MNQLIRFLIKANFYFFIVCIVFTILAAVFGGVWKIIPYIFLLFFFYDWNVATKTNKTWLYIETLPINLLKRYFLRVIFPFIFCFIILLSLEVLKKTGEVDYAKSIIDSLRQSSIFLLSSIITSSLGGYVLSIITLNFIALNLSFFHFYIVFILIFTFLYTYYFLSGKRVSKTKVLNIPTLICIFILLAGNYFKESFYSAFLSIPLESLQVYSAETLIHNNAFIKVPKHFLLDSWTKNTQDNYIYDDSLLQKIEKVAIRGKECSQSCYELARIVENFPQEWNLPRLSSYLNSNEESKQIYVLEILRASRKIFFFNRVIQLAQSENEEVKHRAAIVLNNWGINSLYNLPRTQAF